MDFYANKKITIGASFTGSIINRNGAGEATAIWRKANGSIDSTIGTYSNSFNKFRNTATNIYLKNTLTTTQDISVDLDFLTYNIGNDQGFNNVLLATGGYNNASHGNIPSRINIWSAKADYSWRFGNAGKLEAGAKSSYINTDNIAAYEQYDGATWKEDLGKSNHFLYKESINALYASVEQKYKRLSFQLGMRYEYTHYDANQLGNAINKDSSFARNYDGLFPSGYISYQADSANTFTFTSGRRLDRPAFQKLNPFVFIINKYTNQRGNPFFLPQFTWNFELSHQYKQLLTTTVSYSIIKNYFSQIFLNEGNGILAYTEGNVGQMQNISVGETVQFSPNNWWSVTAQAMYNYKKFIGFLGNNVTTNVSQLSANLNNQFKINPALSAELSGFYITGARNDIQELLRPTGQLSAGVAMQVLKKKGTLKLNVRDMFYTQKMEGDTEFEGANEYFILLRDSRVVNLAFTYRFGKPIKSAKRNSGGATDEMQRAGSN